ncbi:hypothetical protein AKJ59_00745, partial [candidate division MSBL1 archaeon SCGC-AAA385M02]
GFLNGGEITIHIPNWVLWSLALSIILSVIKNLWEIIWKHILGNGNKQTQELKTIKDNHLKHIEEKLNNIEETSKETDKKIFEYIDNIRTVLMEHEGRISKLE